MKERIIGSDTLLYCPKCHIQAYMDCCDLPYSLEYWDREQIENCDLNSVKEQIVTFFLFFAAHRYHGMVVGPDNSIMARWSHPDDVPPLVELYPR